MDDQGVIAKDRLGGRFLKVHPAHFDMFDLDWMQPITGVPKVEFRKMLDNVYNGDWALWRLPYPAKGIAVSYPKDGLLFVYYLHGRDLFGSLTKEDLMKAAHDEGLNGCAAHTKDRRVARILKHIGFQEVESPDPEFICLELR